MAELTLLASLRPQFLLDTTINNILAVYMYIVCIIHDTTKG